MTGHPNSAQPAIAPEFHPDDQRHGLADSERRAAVSRRQLTSATEMKGCMMDKLLTRLVGAAELDPASGGLQVALIWPSRNTWYSASSYPSPKRPRVPARWSATRGPWSSFPFQLSAFSISAFCS